MKNKQINITKASGETVIFSEKKLMKSLKRAGSSEGTALSVVNEVSASLYEGITTKKIYRMAFNLLKRHSNDAAARYNLKAAIMELGPSGYPFEKYVAAILRYQGYTVKIGQIVKGKCVSHEIDVIAEKGNEHFMIECKYHNEPGTVSNVKIPLYIHSRFKDVEAAWLEMKGHGTKFHQGWVVTNTKFSSDAIQYGSCAGLKLIGWDYPLKDSLNNMIDDLGLYPITCLTSLQKSEKIYLLENKGVLCKEITENPHWLKSAGISVERIKGILEEANSLCKKIIANDKP